IFVKNFFERLASMGGGENAALLVRAIRVAFDGHEQAIRIFGVDENRGDLLSVAEAEVFPSFSRIGGLVETVASGEVRALQPLAAANVENVGIGRRDGDSSDRAGVLIV